MHTGARHFLPRLKGVPGVGKKNAAGGFDEEESRASGKPAEITDVGGMRYKQGVGTQAGKAKPEPIDPAPARFWLASLHDQLCYIGRILGVRKNSNS